MEYTFIKDKRFKNNLINIYFDMPFNSELDLAFKILALEMTNYTKTYSTKEKMTYIKDYLYGINHCFSYSSNELEACFKLTLSFLNPHYTNLEVNDIFDFIKEILLNPLFNERYVKESLDQIRDGIDRKLDKPLNYAINRIYQVNQDTALKKLDIDCKKDLDKFDCRLLNKAYEELKNASVRAYVNGNMDDKVLESFFQQLPFKTKTFLYHSHKCNIKDRGLLIEEKELSQSCFIAVYENDYLYDDNRYYHLLVADALLGSLPNSLLFNIAREKYSLCYSIFTRLYKKIGISFIVSMISYQNYPKLLEVIDECILNLIKENYEDSYLKDAKNYLINSLKGIKDDPNALINFMHNQKMSIKNLSLEEMFIKINEVTKADVSACLKSYKRKMVYVLRGINDERV